MSVWYFLKLVSPQQYNGTSVVRVATSDQSFGEVGIWKDVVETMEHSIAH